MPVRTCIILPSDPITDSSLPFGLTTADRQTIELVITIQDQALDVIATVRFIYRQLMRAAVVPHQVSTEYVAGLISDYIQRHLEIIWPGIVARTTRAEVLDLRKRCEREVRQEMLVPAHHGVCKVY